MGFHGFPILSTLDAAFSSEKVTTMNKRKNENGEPRVEGEWDAEVSIKRQKDRTHQSMARKVLTNGVIKIPVYSLACNSKVISHHLRCGKEVLLTDERENPIIRLFPCMNTDFTEMYVSAQTLGDFRHKTLEGIKWHTTYCGSDRSNDEVRELNDAVRSINKERKFIEVTPDTIIECPKCGTEIRVGKVLGNK